jgi:hypothetical protein
MREGSNDPKRTRATISFHTIKIAHVGTKEVGHGSVNSALC